VSARAVIAPRALMRGRACGAPARAVALLLGAGVATPLAAQDRLVGARQVATGALGEHVRFKGLLRLDQEGRGDSVQVRGLVQFQLPFTAAVPMGPNWTLDVGTYYTATQVTLADAGRTRTVNLAGPGDTRVRAVGRLRDDGLVVTLGLNAPSGMRQLTTDALDVLRVASAPALGLGSAPVSAGLGATLGVVAARGSDAGGVAAGASYEVRARYQPVAARLLGTTPAQYTPGGAVRVTLAGERRLGSHKLVVNLAGDLFLEDILESGTGADVVRATVRPGPLLSAEGELQLAAPGVRELSLWTLVRRRQPFERDGGALVGSEATYVDGGVRASIPLLSRLDVTTALDARWQSGMRVAPGVLTMGGVAGVGTLGLSWRSGSSTIQPFVRAQGGNLRQRLGPDVAPVADGDFFGMTFGLLFSRSF